MPLWILSKIMLNLFRTIAAISTPPGKGGVSLIRISGEEAFAVCDKCFVPRYGDTPLSQRAPRTAIRGDIVLKGEPIDDGMAYLFPGPKSYTGEDTVEITCHGGILVTKLVLEAVLYAGAFPAEAGEFTRRAFLNGNLSLSEAEAIGNLLEAESIGQVRLAKRESRTKLKEALDGIHTKMVTLLSSLYAVIDYPEEDLAEMSREDMVASLTALLGDVDALLRTYRTGHAVHEGIHTVICGKPNVGKSSLYNLLCLEDAAIVTDIAGTTRDVLEKTVALGDVTLRLFDTAGLRETEDTVEQIGVKRSREKLEEAELILAVFDGSSPLQEEDRDLLHYLKTSGIPSILILNKADKGLLDMREITEHFPHVIPLSCHGGNSDELSLSVKQLFTDGDIVVGQDAIISGARQYAALSRARDLVKTTLDALSMGLPQEVACSDLEIALGAISELDGREVSQDIVKSIFSHFCVGK